MTSSILEFEKIVSFTEYVLKGLDCSFPLIPKPTVSAIRSVGTEKSNDYNITIMFEFLQHCSNIIKLHDIEPGQLYLPFNPKYNFDIIEKYNIKEFDLLIDQTNFRKGSPDFILFDDNKKSIIELSQYKAKVYGKPYHSHN